MDTPVMSIALTDRVMGQWATLQARWDNLPATLQVVLDQLGARVRRVLALPSQEELATLSARLDVLDARLQELAEARTSLATVATRVAAMDLAPAKAAVRKARAVVASKQTRKPRKA